MTIIHRHAVFVFALGYENEQLAARKYAATSTLAQTKKPIGIGDAP